jgi:dolichol-phosphate mannosyltransferase
MSSQNPTPHNSGERPLLSVVIPTHDERENIERLVRTLLEVCSPTPTEVIVVDDGSPDGTSEVVRGMSDADARVKLVAREGKLGLSSAVYAGAAAGSGTYVCVMDADFSHDPEEVPQMLARAQQGYSVVIGSRYVKGSAFIGQPFPRRAISYVLNLAARVLLQIRARDALTGFAIVERDVLLATPTRYSAGGFKWLVELLATQRDLRVAEWPIIFRDRTAGLSKASAKEAIIFAVLCGRLLIWQAKGRLPLG